ncbi:phospholipid-transporting ATPase ABCA3 isoform X2 [Diabrotica virgifera virgifera]|uniref:ABC transporter domain-containing protein n=1 Tax=Diabrotica virgifera virgifera TaxID=50390 RepID=A0ABM5JQF7_DIAVI|nr:phospholipid-transporting ATPase ABCA3 isoform X2 [Diabrotica virgifera virgifera]
MSLLQLEVVVWKNYIIRKRHWFLTIIESFLPVCLFLLIAYGRSQITGLNKIEVPNPTYGRIDGINYNIDVAGTYILYTPYNEYYTNITTKMLTKLGMPSDHIQRFGSENELLGYYYKNPNYTTVAIIFDDKNPKHFNYKIRYHKNYYQPEFLVTDRMYQRVYGYSPGSEYVYRDEDFLKIQLALDMSFLEENLRSSNIEDTYSIQIQEFPYPPHKVDSAITTLFLEFLPLITLFSFIFLCPAVLKRVVEEKHSGTKELMKMVGMKSWMLWFGWFIYAMIPMFFAVSVISIFMKVPMFGSDSPLVEFANGGILFVFLILYCMAAVAFCFAISSFFSRPTIALVAGILVWILSFFIPKYACGLDEANKLSWLSNVLLNLLPNMSLHYGYSIISVFEEREVGINWSNFFKPGSGSSDDITMLNVYVMLIVDIVIYTIFTFYMDGVNPGKYGVRKSILFPLQNFMKLCRKPSITTVPVDSETVPLEKVEAGHNLAKGIQINHLHKRYKQKQAVNNLNLDIYKNQITVLLGHNGAGKSTTMSIITGLIPATSGSVTINGLDINTDMDEIRKSLGLCPQHNLLFTDLTVKEHLLFFAKLKGKSTKEANIEAKSLLAKLNMPDKEHSMAQTLSGGMQRKLCLAMALIGDSKVLILDEPSSGMDPQSRRELWDLLLQWRGEKTILITTHFMEEADALGDWIAIMSDGSLNCYGTPMFLKKKYDTGYHLNLMIEEDADIDAISRRVKHFMPDAHLTSNNGNNLVFVLPYQNTNMTGLLGDLEKNRSELHLSNISITITTLEDVFLKTRQEIEHSSDDTSSVATQDDIQPHASLTLITLLKKKVNFSLKKWSTYIVPVGVAVVLFSLTVFLSSGNDYYSERGPELPLKLSSYKQTSVYYSGDTSNEKINTLMKYYMSAVESQRSLPFKVDNVEKSILQRSLENIAYYKEHMIAGANFVYDRDFTLVALYNGIATHSTPISLNLITDSLAKTLLGPEYGISVSNWPLPQVQERLSSQEYSEAKVAVLWLILLPVGCLFIHGIFIIFPHTEISTRFLQIQYMAGVKPFFYWLVNWIADMTFYIFLMFILSFLLWICSPVFQHNGTELGYLFSIFLCYGIAGIPFAYIFSRKKTASGAFALFVIMGMFLGIILTLTIAVLLESQDEYYVNIGNKIKYVCFFLLPQVSLSDALVSFIRRTVNIYNFKISPQRLRVMCNQMESHACCVESSIECQNYKSYNNLFSEHYMFMIGCGVFYLTINIILDTYFMKKLKAMVMRQCNLILKSFKDKDTALIPKNDKYVNEDVGDGYNTLRAKKIMKLYAGKQIVKNINFTLKHGHCLGILGVNGAGKTTTFKMLTREEVVDDGEIKIELDNNKQPLDITGSEYLETIGYCPQSDSLNFVLTGRQLLSTVAKLRGVTDETMIDRFLEAFDLKQYADIPCGHYSGGNKRKLSLAISLIGNRKFVLLDEPTNGVDPATRRKCWDLIKLMKGNSGNKIGFILTSHSMTECEALCDELKIMKKGSFVEEGRLVDLKNRYGGFTLKLKLVSNQGQPINLVDDDVDEVDGVISNKFKSVDDLKSYFTNHDRGEIKDEHSGLLHVYIKDKTKKWSDIFQEVEALKTHNSHLIEDYAISEASLEDVFLKVAREDEEDVTKKK